MLEAYQSSEAQLPAESSRPKFASIGSIEVFSNEVLQLITADSPIEVLADGFTWTEGPVWMREPSSGDGHLLFSDIPRNSIFRWSDTEGISLFMQPSGYTGVEYYGLEPGSNGLNRDASGDLILCEHGDRRVSKLTRGGGKITLADKFEGKRFNSPNDATILSNGDIVFTDPPYGLPLRENDPQRELDFCGVFHWDHNTGTVKLLTAELDRPNGIAISPDQKTLYVAQSLQSKAIWMRYDLTPEYRLANGSVFYDATDQTTLFDGLPDGMCVDEQGNVWASGPGGVYIFKPTGKLLGRILTGQRTSNCTFGEDGRSLFITADALLLRVKTKVKGSSIGELR